MRLSAGLSFFLILVAIAAGLIPVIAIGFGHGYHLTRLFDAYFFRVLTFTIIQATLSTASLDPLRHSGRPRFGASAIPGRGFVLRLFALPLALPAIVAILGIVEVYGRSGWLSRLTSA